MTLECTVIGISGSRAMTNEDLSNTRHYYQTQVVEKVGSSKFSLNPENTVSLLDMSQVQMILHNARNNSDIMRILHSVRYGMPIFLHESIRTAMQALKHRPDMNQRQRIVLIIDSSLKLDPEDQESIMKLTKTIKKLKINVDIIIIGTECSLKDFFTEFIKNVNGPDNLR
ncbi:MAG: Pros54p [Paramarteilia canceri]